MEWIETTGKTVEEARELALDQLGVDERETEFEVIDEPKVGLFGRTRGIARVRARIVPKSPRAKTERKRGSKKKGEGSGSKGDAAGKASTASESPRSRSSSKRPAASQDDAGTNSGKTENSGESEESESDTSASGSRKPKAATGNRRESRPSDRNKEPMDEQEQISVVEDFLKDLSKAFGMDVGVTSAFDDGDLRVDMTGDNLGLLVGPKLATLDAIQEVSRNALQRQAAGREYARLTVDAVGIRARRREALSEFVAEAAETAKGDATAVVFEVMSSADRKQVHDVAGEIEGISSASEGEDPRRRVVINADLS